MVAQDSASNLLLAGVRRVRATWSLTISEMAAAIYEVEPVIRLGYSFVHLEGDNAGSCASPQSISPWF